MEEVMAGTAFGDRSLNSSAEDFRDLSDDGGTTPDLHPAPPPPPEMEPMPTPQPVPQEPTHVVYHDVPGKQNDVVYPLPQQSEPYVNRDDDKEDIGHCMNDIM